MILECVKGIECNLKEEKKYFCIEVSISFYKSDIAYRIVEDHGEICIYKASMFEIHNDVLENMIFKVNERSCVIQLKEIEELDKECKDVNGVWGEYHDGKNPELEKKIHEIVIKQAALEGIDIPQINVV